MRPRWFLPAALAVAWLGYWGPWLEHPAGALRLNAYDLSEWVTFLPEVAAGQLPLSRLAFLIPSACLAVLFGLAVNAGQRGRRRSEHWLRAHLPDTPLGWVLLALAVLSALTVFPYYPYILTAYADPEFRVQFFVAGLALAGAALAVFVPDDANALVRIGLALVGAGCAIGNLVVLWPAAAAVGGPIWALGWGWAALLLGFLAIIVHGWRTIFQPRR